MSITYIHGWPVTRQGRRTHAIVTRGWNRGSGGCRAMGRKRRNGKVGAWRRSARMLCLVDPARQTLPVGTFNIDELDAHANPQLDDADDT